MTVIFQATAEVTDWDRFRAAIDWVRDEVTSPEGFISLRVFRASSDSNRVTLLEEWSDADAFYTSLRDQGPTAGPEFLARTGLTAADFESQLWTQADIETIGG